MITEMMAKGTYACILSPPRTSTPPFDSCRPATPRSSRSRPTSRTASRLRLPRPRRQPGPDPGAALTEVAAAALSYREVLRDRRVAGLLLGDLLANVGTGMILVAMPVQTLSLHGSVPKAIAIGLVEAAPFVLATVLALAIGLAGCGCRRARC